MRFSLSWFNPLRNPFRLISELKESISWLNDFEDKNPEYKKYSNQGTSGIIGLMSQVMIAFIVLQIIGVIFID